MQTQKKILLLNSFAVNNGDLALVIALYEQLIVRGYSVTIATYYYDFLKEKYPTLPLTKELLDFRFLNRVSFLKKLFLQLRFHFDKAYHDHDVFIGCPGGYVNSYYGIKRSLFSLILAKRKQKKTAIYSQSVGPLNKKDSKLLTNFSKSIDVILVRDDFSKACISSIPCYSKVFQTKDAAFLLTPRVSNASLDCKRVAVSVREWKHDKRSMKNFSTMIKSLCEIVLAKGYSVEFISTCQGVENYRDDSKTANSIRDLIIHDNPSYANQITVDSGYHTYYDLVDLLNTRYAFTIGTRLHMCILSLINGTPAFNISYEVKGIECYRYLGLEKYSADFNESDTIAIQKFNTFLEGHKEIQSSLLNRIQPIQQESKAALEMFIKEMAI